MKRKRKETPKFIKVYDYKDENFYKKEAPRNQLEAKQNKDKTVNNRLIFAKI